MRGVNRKRCEPGSGTRLGLRRGTTKWKTPVVVSGALSLVLSLDEQRKNIKDIGEQAHEVSAGSRSIDLNEIKI